MSSLLAFCLCCTGSLVSASEMWGINGGNGTSIYLRLIDPVTGTVLSSTSSGSGLNYAGVDDLTSDPARQPTVVWAVRTSSAGNELIAVNPFQEQMLSLVLLDAPETILSIAIDPTTGVFYGASAGLLYQITPDTGTTTLVGATSLSVSKALGFDLQGNLYGVWNSNNLVAVNKSTGATSLIDTLDVRRMEDIAPRPEDGTMYGLGYDDSGYSLFRIDVSTANVTTAGPSLIRPSGLAFTVVPEPTGAVSLLLGLFLLIAQRVDCRNMIRLCEAK